MKNEFTYNNEILEIRFSDKIEFMTSVFLSEVYFEINKKEIKQLILNLSATEFITLPGAILLLCFSANLKRRKNPYLDTRISIDSRNIITYLVNIGFFIQMNVYANLMIPKNVLSKEKSIKEKKFRDKIISSDSSIVFPISIIPENVGESYFEDYSRSFVNNFNDFFCELCSNQRFGFSDDLQESQELFGALFENIKNIYDHSGTMGFGAIHSSINQKGTIISFFDFGQGIVNTVFKSGKFDTNRNRPDAIYWALEDGNSSRGGNGNQGLGFTIIKNFVKKKDGILSIRTDNYLVNYRNGKESLAKTVGYFPGTQIVIYIPLKLKK